jgi:hypothetical protein
MAATKNALTLNLRSLSIICPTFVDSISNVKKVQASLVGLLNGTEGYPLTSKYLSHPEFSIFEAKRQIFADHQVFVSLVASCFATR